MFLNITPWCDYAKNLILVRLFDLFSKFRSVNFGFPAVWSWKFWFRKVREVCRKIFHLVAPLKTSMVTSYDQKTKICQDYLHHDYLHLSVNSEMLTPEIFWSNSGILPDIFRNISGHLPETLCFFSGKIPEKIKNISGQIPEEFLICSSRSNKVPQW